MNALLRLRKDMVICNLVPFKYLLYAALLSDVTVLEEDDIKNGVYAGTHSDLYDFLSEWDCSDPRRSELDKAMKELSEEGLIFFDSEDENIIYLGEYRGRKLFTFEVKNSMSEKAVETLYKSIDNFRKTKSCAAKFRGRYIREWCENIIGKGIDKMQPGDFTDFHGLLYELYTGGKTYIIRNKVEYFQTTNMLKAYDKFTTFAIMVEGVLQYDMYRKKGVPTLTNVACMKDEVFKGLTNPDAGSKDYMREISVTDESEF